MKTCPVCQRFFEDSVAVCPENHGSLVAARASFPATIGDYRLGDRLAGNAWENTYQAAHAVREQIFEVRIIAAEAAGATKIERETLAAEARRAAGIVHPNVARTFESGWLANGDFYVVSESSAGQTLGEHLRTVGTLPETEAVAVAGQTAQALEAAHRAAVIHRAVNPANIILGTDSENRRSIKLVNFDFGALRQQAVVGELSRLHPPTDAQRYLSPEQCARETVDARTDIFSLGWLLYAMLCGREPFGAPVSAAEISDRQIDEQPLVHLRYDVRALLAYLLKQSLQTSAAARLSSAANFARQLRQVEQLVAPPIGMRRAAPQIFAAKKDAAGETAAISLETPAPDTNDSPGENYRPAESDVNNARAATDTPPPLNQIDTVIPTEKTVESPLGAVIFPGWSPLPSVTGKSVDDAPAPEPSLIEKNETSLDSFESPPIPVRKKHRDAISPEIIPSAAEIPFENAPESFAVEHAGEAARPRIAEPDDFHAVKINGERSEPRVPVSSRENEPRNRPRKAFSAKRSQWLVGAALIALIAAGLGMFLYNRLHRTSDIEQAAVKETPIAAAPTARPPADTEQNDALNAEPETAETEEFAAPVAGRESPSTNPKSGTPNQTRREAPATALASDETQPPHDANAVQTAGANSTAGNKPGEIASGESSGTSSEQTELNSSLDRWISATNNRDVEQQMNYYAPQVNAYYQARNASPDLVRAEKKRIFERASVVDIQTGKPEITVSRDGRSATMRFRKKYAIREGQKNRSGEVIQELRWVKSGGDWKIVSERDVKVIKR